MSSEQPAATGKKSRHEEFARFFEHPTREGFREVVRTNVGELDEFDFKQAWPKFSKVARHILGFANSGGGAIAFGIREDPDGSLSPDGLPKLEDKADVHNAVSKFLPASLKYEVHDYTFEATEYGPIKGKKFQVLLVEDDPKRLPFVAEADGDTIRSGGVYVRRGTQTIEATHDDLQGLINRRIETGHSSSRELALERHLSELRVLYGEIQQYVFAAAFSSLWTTAQLVGTLYDRNPAYPQESFEAFVGRMIVEKKRLIESLLLQREPEAPR